MKVSVVLERVLKSPKNRTKYYKFVSRSCEDLAEIKTVFYSLMSYQICLRCNYLICMYFFHCLILCVEDIENKDAISKRAKSGSPAVLSIRSDEDINKIRQSIWAYLRRDMQPFITTANVTNRIFRITKVKLHTDDRIKMRNSHFNKNWT